MKTYYYVLRTHSHTDRQQLWKVMSRRMASKFDAENWRDYKKAMEKNKNHEFFVISKEEKEPT